VDTAGAPVENVEILKMRRLFLVLALVLPATFAGAAPRIGIARPGVGPVRFEWSELQRAIATYLEGYVVRWSIDEGAPDDVTAQFAWIDESLSATVTSVARGQSIAFAVRFSRNPNVNFYRAVALKLLTAVRAELSAEALPTIADSSEEVERIEYATVRAAPPTHFALELSGGVALGSAIGTVGGSSRLGFSIGQSAWQQLLELGFSPGSRGQLFDLTLAFGYRWPQLLGSWGATLLAGPNVTVLRQQGTFYGDLAARLSARMDLRFAENWYF
jgi:hypothetical protein